MSDPIDRLRALDPERGGAAAPPIGPLLARIDAARDDGGRAADAPVRRRRPVAAAVALACLAAIAVAAVVLAGGGAADDGPRVPARSPSETIVHTVMRVNVSDGRGRWYPMQFQGGGRTIDTVERWSAPAPARWRELTRLGAGTGETYEQSYARDVQQTRRSWERTVDRMRGTGSPQRGLGLALRTATVWSCPGGLPAPTPLPVDSGLALIGGVADPRATVASMVARGEVRAAGELTRDGRRLRAFVCTRRGGRRGKLRWPALRTVYLVDAETYAPVEVEISSDDVVPGVRGPIRMRSTTRLVFERYETIPLDAASARLLRLGGR